MNDDTAVLHALFRHDLSSFIQKCFHTLAPAQRYQHNWHIDVIAWHLQACLAGDIRRLIITMPPRSLKSICASVAFTAWALGHDPTRRIIAASYSTDLSRKHALDNRTIMGCPWYKLIFPRTRLHPDKNTELEIMTTARGFRIATSVGGTLTGRGDQKLLLNFSKVEYISNAAIGILIGLHKKATASGGSLILCNVSPVVFEHFSTRKLNKVFDFQAEEESALKAFE